MNKTVCFVSVIAMGTVFGTGAALAEKCSGYAAVKSDAPDIVLKAEDGAQTMYISNSRILTVKEPANSAFDGAWGKCTGILKVAADGKSGTGSGVCYTVDRDGDYTTVTWEGFTGGTWETIGGTGKFEKSVGDAGTWTGMPPLANGWNVSPFEGDCTPVATQ